MAYTYKSKWTGNVVTVDAPLTSQQMKDLGYEPYTPPAPATPPPSQPPSGQPSGSPPPPAAPPPQQPQAQPQQPVITPEMIADAKNQLSAIPEGGYVKLNDGSTVYKKEGGTFRPLSGRWEEEDFRRYTGGKGFDTVKNLNFDSNLYVRAGMWSNDGIKPIPRPDSGATTGPGTGTTPGTSTSGDDYLASSGLPDELKALIKEISGMFDPAKSIDDEAILDAFEQIKAKTVDPYFREIIGQNIYDLRTVLQRAEEDRTAELEAEGANASENIRSATGSLEESGLLRTGESPRLLGPGSPYQTSAEGLIPSINRRIAEGSRRQYERGLRDTGLAAERALGTKEFLGANFSVPGYAPQGNITGEIPFKREQTESDLLSRLISQEHALSAYRRLYI